MLMSPVQVRVQGESASILPDRALVGEPADPPQQYSLGLMGLCELRVEAERLLTRDLGPFQRRRVAWCELIHPDRIGAPQLRLGSGECRLERDGTLKQCARHRIVCPALASHTNLALQVQVVGLAVRRRRSGSVHFPLGLSAPRTEIEGNNERDDRNGGEARYEREHYAPWHAPLPRCGGPGRS